MYDGPLALADVEYDFDYHGDGLRKQLRAEYIPAGGTGTVLYNDQSEYDDLGRLVTLTQQGGDVGNKHVGFDYNKEGQLTLLERYTGLPTSNPVLVGSTVYEYDHPAGWLTEITHRKADNSTITAYGYTYEESGRLASQTLTSGGQTVTRNYAYDQADQLTGVTNATAQTLEDYDYDAAGNRTAATVSATGGAQQQRLPDGHPQSPHRRRRVHVHVRRRRQSCQPHPEERRAVHPVHVRP